MNKEKFLAICKPYKNIINTEEINGVLSQIIKQKKLDNKEHIKKWILSNVRKYFLNKEQYKEFEFNNLSEELKFWVKQYNIKSPYHVVNINPESISTVNHCIDYICDEFKNYRDLSRLTVEQAKINADQWLKNKLKHLSDEEDTENIIPIFNIEQDGEKYTWINIRSHKGLQRESKMMNHCIETYWGQEFNDPVANEETGFYSLRDKNNNSLVTMYLQKDLSQNKEIVLITEIKEHNNNFLSNKNRDLVKEFLNGFKKNLYVQDETTYLMVDYKENKIGFSKLVSLNDYIKDKKIYGKEKFDFNEFKDDFQLENLYATLNFKELNIEKETFIGEIFFAEKITINNIQNKKFKCETNYIKLSNLTNCSIEIDNSTKENANENYLFIFGNNLNKCEIKIKGNVKQVVCIMKDSANNTFENSNDKILFNYIIENNDSFDRINTSKQVNTSLLRTGIELRVFSLDNKLNKDKKSNLQYYWEEIMAGTIVKYDEIIARNLSCYKEYLVSQNSMLPSIYKDIIKELDIKLKDNGLSVKLYNYEINEINQFVIGLFKNPREQIDSILNNIENINLLIKDELLFVERNGLSLLKQDSHRLSEYFMLQVNELKNKYEKLLKNYNNKFREDIIKNDDYFLNNYLKMVEKYLNESKEFMNPLLATIIKNDIIENSAQIENLTTEALIVNEKDRIRNRRAKNIANWLFNLNKSAIEEDEINKIFMEHYNRTINLTNTPKALKDNISGIVNSLRKSRIF